VKVVTANDYLFHPIVTCTQQACALYYLTILT